jgi:CBS domain containing-hemolysin-like protein
MTPIREGEVLVEGFSREDVVRIGAKGDLNCVPVRRAEGEDYRGFVDVLDLIFRPDDAPEALVRPALRIPETASAGEAMRMLGRDRAKLCFVVRPDGSVAGTASARGLSELIAGKL